MNQITMKFIETNGIKLQCRIAGPKDGEPVFLLHGFPDASFGWEAQIMALAQEGFRVIAPDQRGYNLSDKPVGIQNYAVEVLVSDILGLADALGISSFNLAGHDFGAMVSWGLAAKHPDRIKRLIIINVPHPTVMMQTLRSSLKQIRKSWYALFFLLPKIPERLVLAKGAKFLLSAFPPLPDGLKQRYMEAWNEPGAITAMINWYRATFSVGSRGGKVSRIKVPTLVLWGKQDRHLGFEMVQPSVDFCDHGRLVVFEEAGHFLMLEKPDEVSQIIIAYLKEGV